MAPVDAANRLQGEEGGSLAEKRLLMLTSPWCSLP